MDRRNATGLVLGSFVTEALAGDAVERGDGEESGGGIVAVEHADEVWDCLLILVGPGADDGGVACGGLGRVKGGDDRGAACGQREREADDAEGRSDRRSRGVRPAAPARCRNGAGRTERGGVGWALHRFCHRKSLSGIWGQGMWSSPGGWEAAGFDLTYAPRFPRPGPTEGRGHVEHWREHWQH